MDTSLTQEMKDHLNSLEENLRLDGKKLDSLWMQARMATGQARTDLHKKIGSLREKQQTDRKERDAMKKDEPLATLSVYPSRGRAS